MRERAKTLEAGPTHWTPLGWMTVTQIAAVSGASRTAVHRRLAEGWEGRDLLLPPNARPLHVKHAAVDLHTSFEDDPVAQRFVLEHPEGGSLDEIGRLLGVGRERVRQIEAAALSKLRETCERDGYDFGDVLTAITQRVPSAWEQGAWWT